LSLGQKPKISLGAAAVALAVVAVFCFHLSRFYLSVDACSHHTRNGYALQHCKDLPDWLTAPRVKLREFSAPIFKPVLQVIRVNIPTLAPAIYGIYLPPPFHPPRLLS